jgi:ATP-binding cassette subfamily F protein 3
LTIHRIPVLCETMIVVKLSDVGYYIGERALLSRASASLNRHDRVGLVGANGSGKTTLLRMINGDVLPSEGSIELRKDTRIGYLPQEEIVLQGHKLIEEVLRDYNACLDDLAKLREQMALEPGSREIYRKYESVEARFQAIGGYQYETEAYKIIAGLGFTKVDHGKTIGDFSSGWQMRIVLARILLRRPDLLLLDEPTNHLDIESIQWLEDYLRNFKGAMVVVSHDRYFLDKILHNAQGTSGIWEIDLGTFRSYRTDYTGYINQSETRKQRLLHRAKVQEKRIGQIKDFIARNKANKSKARVVKSREKYLARMERVQVEQDRRTMKLDFPSVTIHSRRLIELQDVTKTYDGHVVFKRINLVIESGDRIALIGKNGAGKSTLSRIICGIEDPTTGMRRASERLQMGIFSHELVRQLDSTNTVLDEMTIGTSPDVSQKMRTYLGLFLFSGDDVLKRVNVLSGGEKTRLVILKAMLKASNLLVLDEPTFHLDRESTDAIKHALLMYEGTVVLVTHDRDLIESFATRIVELQNGNVHDYPGDFSYYLWKRKDESGVSKQKIVQLKKESRTEQIRRIIIEKEERRSKLRQSFIRQAGVVKSKNARKLFDEYQRLTLEIEELEGQANSESNNVRSE